MSDQQLSRFLGYGTAAERVAFTPAPPPVAAAPSPLYQWYETDTGQLWFYTTLWFLASSAGPFAVIDAGEALNANDAVNLFDAGGGVFNAQIADASDPTKPAHGFVLAAVIMGDPATVFFSGVCAGQSGLVPGAVYLDPSNPGLVTNTLPSAGGTILQPVGVAASATEYAFTYSSPTPL